MIEIRDYQAGDANQIAKVFYRGVREGAAPAYTDAQLAVWASPDALSADWAARLDGLHTVVAVQGGLVIGFMCWRTRDGYLDLAFVLPEQRRTGLAALIYKRVEADARSANLARLWTHASKMARPFFLRQGWRENTPDPIERDGETLMRWIMEKPLT